jgi:hypothetical protein
MRPFNLTTCLLTLIAALNLSPTVVAQTLRDQARELGPKNPGEPLYWPAPPAEFWPKTIDEITQEADLVVLAKLVRMKSYLSPHEDSILTDYSISDMQVLTARTPLLPSRVPGTEVPLTLTVYGGDVTVDGVLIRGRDSNFEPIKDGGRYVLILKGSRSEKGHYEIHQGGLFEIVQEDVRPLVMRADTMFKNTVPLRLRDLVARIQKAAQVR